MRGQLVVFGYAWRFRRLRRRIRCALRNAVCSLLGHIPVARNVVESYDAVDECQRCHLVLEYREREAV